LISVAIVDKDFQFVRSLSRYFQNRSQFIVTGNYYNVMDALHGLREIPVQIVLIDIDMHVEDCLGLMRALQTFEVESKCMVLTNLQDERIAFKAFSAGASGYLLKESTSECINEAMEELLNGGSPVSPLVSKKLMHSLDFRLEEDRERIANNHKSTRFAIQEGLKGFWKNIRGLPGIF
jgi:DNA-binding NarL/FixJ family response regulator